MSYESRHLWICCLSNIFLDKSYEIARYSILQLNLQGQSLLSSLKENVVFYALMLIAIGAICNYSSLLTFQPDSFILPLMHMAITDDFKKLNHSFTILRLLFGLHLVVVFFCFGKSNFVLLTSRLQLLSNVKRMNSSFQVGRPFKIAMTVLTVAVFTLLLLAAILVSVANILLAYTIIFVVALIALTIFACFSGCGYLRLLRKAATFQEEHDPEAAKQYSLYLKRVAVCMIIIVISFNSVAIFFPVYWFARYTPTGYIMAQMGFRLGELMGCGSLLSITFQRKEPAKLRVQNISSSSKTASRTDLFVDPQKEESS